MGVTHYPIERHAVRKTEKLSRYQRRATPIPFCRYLVARLFSIHFQPKIAVLWVEKKSPYWQLWPVVEVHGIGRNALCYPGPFPIIAHPPCGPWGKFAWKSLESKEHGITALELVHKYGGVVEQPAGSQLFKLFGRPTARIEKVDQFDFGHMARKPTLLYWYDMPDGQ